jgi:hypothetical protein
LAGRASATLSAVGKTADEGLSRGAYPAPRQDFPGPGTAYSTLFSEPEQFNFLRRWKQLIAQDG